ncbi:metallophosphoesterase [Cytophagaceae bacterium ABcell3]|nr:metallophosphoesterase [Cytophagaceae bacterium ABcell3]
MTKKITYILLASIGILVLLIDWYVFQGIKTLTTSAGMSAIVNTAYWVLFTGINILLFYFILGIRGREISTWAKTFFHLYLTILVTKLSFVTIMLGEDVYRTLAFAYNYNSEGEQHLPLRSKLVSKIGIVLASFPFAFFIYGISKGKYAYKVRKEVLYFDDLPEAFEGFTLTQISDIHAGSLDNPIAVKKGIELINAQNSDLFVFTGDIVNNEASELKPWIEIFKEIKAPYGKYSVLGNHDYGDYISWPSVEDKRTNLQNLKRFHKEIGFHLLLDNHVTIEKGGEKISLLGVENWGLGFGQKGDLKKALLGVEKSSFKVLLSHDPTHWEEVVKKEEVPVHLTLSGHTHGMQFGFELLGFKWSPVKYRYPHWAGMKKENGKHLYINRGFGFIGFSGRVGIWPEITVIEFRKKVIQKDSPLTKSQNKSIRSMEINI